MTNTKDNKIRCSWCEGDTLYMEYHDKEWGRPMHDDRTLFEFLILEGAQAGLNWLTILKKREGYRKAFANFDVAKIAKYNEEKVQTLLQDEGIVRNQLKIRSAIRNAKTFITIQKEFGSFDEYIWGFVDGKQIVNNIKGMKTIPITTEISDQISKDLKKRGFNFVGSTIIYAYMQAIGMVDDHFSDCWCKKAK